jgi:asparagine synthase (glutamine-hydrolysing)
MKGPPVVAEELRRMGDLLCWRGPDDEGFLLETREGKRYLFGGADTPAETYDGGLPYSPSRSLPGGETKGIAGFSFRRLSILDLSPSGHQPMSDPTGRFWLIFNGEIYNYVELREELIARGHTFASSGDAAVILAAYTQWGPECVTHFNGMWGFAIWDAKEQELFVARDRFGIKPMYYQWDGETLRFASELKPLVMDRERKIDLISVYDLIARDWVDYRPETFFEGTVRLPPAHALKVGSNGLKIWQWWDLPSAAADCATEVPDHARGIVEMFGERFRDAVRIRLRSDVPVGTCLSGGLDSSAIVMTASSQLDQAMRVFTVGYTDPRFDEREHAYAVAQSAGAEYFEVTPDGDDFFEVFEKIVWHQEEPAAGSGIYSQWHVMQLAHRHGMKVLLDGQGGDELLAGYHRYAVPYLQDLIRRGRFGDFIGDVWKVGRRQGMVETAAKVLLTGRARPIFEWGRRTFGQGKDRVVHPDLAAAVGAPEPMPPHRFPTHLSDVLGWEITSRFLPSLLRYEDRNSMTHSIETRLPFLDYRMVEFVFALPPEYRLRGTATKWILREALQDVLPGRVMARRDKMGYETPTDLWFRGKYRDRVRELLLGPDARSQEYLWRPALEREMEDYFEGRREIGLQVWRWLHLELWLRTFIPVRSPAPAGRERVAP